MQCANTKSRFGLFKTFGRTLAAKVVKPLCKFKQVFLSTYLFGASLSITGDSFLMELLNCIGCTFQSFLNEFYLQNNNE